MELACRWAGVSLRCGASNGRFTEQETQLKSKAIAKLISLLSIGPPRTPEGVPDFIVLIEQGPFRAELYVPYTTNILIIFSPTRLCQTDKYMPELQETRVSPAPALLELGAKIAEGLPHRGQFFPQSDNFPFQFVQSLIFSAETEGGLFGAGNYLGGLDPGNLT